jgi:hypothetical protein
MWVFLNDAMLSIVQSPEAPDRLLVRGRIKGDIEVVFPQAKVTETPSRDYRFRATLHRDLVKAAMAAEVDRITYGNFKASVPEQARHDAYLGVWGVMNDEQQRRLAPVRKRPARRGGMKSSALLFGPGSGSFFNDGDDWHGPIHREPLR